MLFRSGRLQDVGSERKKIEALIARAANEAVKHVALRVTGAAPNIKLEIDGNDGASPAKPATVWLVAYDHVRTTKITRGENAGLSLDNYNVVRRMDRLGQFLGEAISIAFDPGPERTEQGRAVIVQNGEAGPILGALRLDR